MHITVQEDAGWLTLLGITAILLLLSLALLIHLFAFHCYLSKSFYLIKRSNEFSYEGIFRQMSISKGRNRDTAWFAVIDKEWKDVEQCFVQFLEDENFDGEGKARVSLSSLTKPLLYKIDNQDII